MKRHSSLVAYVDEDDDYDDYDDNDKPKRGFAASQRRKQAEKRKGFTRFDADDESEKEEDFLDNIAKKGKKNSSSGCGGRVKSAREYMKRQEEQRSSSGGNPRGVGGSGKRDNLSPSFSSSRSDNDEEDGSKGGRYILPGGIVDAVSSSSRKRQYDSDDEGTDCSNHDDGVQGENRTARYINYYLRMYLDTLINSVRLHPYNMERSYEIIPTVVDNILKYNNVRFSKVKMHTTTHELPEPLWFDIDMENYKLFLYINVQEYLDYCLITSSVPVIWPNGQPSIEEYNPREMPPLMELLQLDRATRKCAVACDHVAQHILHRMSPNFSDRACLHEGWTDCHGTTLHSLFALEVTTLERGSSSSALGGVNGGSGAGKSSESMGHISRFMTTLTTLPQHYAYDSVNNVALVDSLNCGGNGYQQQQSSWYSPSYY